MYQQQGPQQPGGYQAGGFVPPPQGYQYANPNVTIPMPGADFGSSLFDEKSIRNAFVSKVFSVLAIQLAFTTALIAIFISNTSIKNYFAQNSLWALAGLGVFFIAYMVLVCSESARRSFPTNFILLAVLTIGLGLEAAIISCLNSTYIVMYAAFTCAVSTILLTLFAKHSSFDITKCGMVLYVLGMIHLTIGLTIGIVLIATGYGKIANLVLAIFGAFLVMCYMVYDVQIIVGGRRHELSPEEYILGSILLYVDIVTLFLYLLQIFQSATDD